MTKTRNHKKPDLYAGEPLRIVHEDGLGTYADLTPQQREHMGRSTFDHYQQWFDRAFKEVQKRQHKLDRALHDLGNAAGMLFSGHTIDYAPADIGEARRNGSISKVKKPARAKR